MTISPVSPSPVPAPGYDESFTGALIGGGLGYNWESVALDFWIHGRSTGDYEDELGVDVGAASGGLSISGRF